MRATNSFERYGIVTVFLHWFMAILIIGMLTLGLYMVRLSVSPEKLKLFRWHKEYGVLILTLVSLRLSWRLLNITPLLPANLPRWQQWAAHAAHYLLYLFMFAMPLTGWLMSSASDLPVSFFGLFVLPNLIAPNHDLRLWFANIHEWLAYGFIALICLHALAALQHHFINKDNILRRMLPW
jgi:cytochrome b561